MLLCKIKSRNTKCGLEFKISEIHSNSGFLCLSCVNFENEVLCIKKLKNKMCLGFECIDSKEVSGIDPHDFFFFFFYGENG